jgi:RND superfamily putative drug exporter
LHRVPPPHQIEPITPLGRWGRFVVHHAWWCLLTPIIISMVLIPVALRATSNLSSVGWVSDEAEANRVQAIVDEEFDQAGNSHFILFSDPDGALTASDREFRLAVEQAVRPFRADPTVAAVYTWGSTGNETLNEMLISQDGSRSVAVIVLKDSSVTDRESVEHLRSNLVSDRLTAQVGGWPATTTAFLDVAESDLVRAEIISLPVTLILLLLIFGGVIAAGIPIALALLSMGLTFAFMFALSQVTLVSTFSINAVTMLGLAVSIDYALIMVSRFREEYASSPIHDAVIRTVATAGHAVIVAGTTVAIGLTGLLLFRVPAAVSTGIIGAFVILIAVLLSLTALPAALVLFGHHIGQRRRGSVHIPTMAKSAYRRVRNVRMRFPLATVLICSVVLISLTLPVRHMVGSSPTISSLPPSIEARVVADVIAESFPHATLSPIAIVVEPRSGSMYDASNLQLMQTFVATLEEHPAIEHTDSIWSLLPPAMTPSTYSTSLLLEPDLARVSTPYVTSNAALVNVTVESSLSADDRRDLVRELRASANHLTGGELDILVGGDTGMDVDVMTFASDHMPGVVIYVLALTWLTLFIQLRSFFLPLKAIALNLLSMGASFGALVWIFQDGHLQHILRFEPTGTTVILIPILMFCFLFGLSMDFEVIILSRIRESWVETGDNDLAVETGIRQTAGIVTSSAVVMLAVFAAFSTSELQIIKTLGVGLAIAVVLDATVIRMLLLPATMQLMGQWNWWTPMALRRSRATSSLPEPGN